MSGPTRSVSSAKLLKSPRRTEVILSVPQLVGHPNFALGQPLRRPVPTASLRQTQRLARHAAISFRCPGRFKSSQLSDSQWSELRLSTPAPQLCRTQDAKLRTEISARTHGLRRSPEAMNIRQVPVRFSAVHAVAHNEVVRNFEPEVVDLDLDDPPSRLAKQGRDTHRLWARAS